MTTSPHDQLFPHDDDPLARYRREDAEHKAVADRERHAEQETREVTALRADIANLRARLDEHDQIIISIADTLQTITEKTPTWVEKMIEGRVLKSEAEICGRIAEKFGELLGRILAIDPAQARAARDEPFKFASEKTDDCGDVVELPNPLPPRRTIN